MPYGTKSRKVLIERGRVVTQTLLSYGIDTIVIACHTSSANCLEALKKEFPDVTFIDMLLPTLYQAQAITRNNKVGVIATEATIASQAHKKLAAMHIPGVTLFDQACPLLVPLIESFSSTYEEKIKALNEYLTPLITHNIDTLILGCTHYAFLEKEIRALAPDIALVSASSCIEQIQPPHTKGTITIVTSGCQNYSDSILHFLADKERTITFKKF